LITLCDVQSGNGLGLFLQLWAHTGLQILKDSTPIQHCANS